MTGRRCPWLARRPPSGPCTRRYPCATSPPSASACAWRRGVGWMRSEFKLWAAVGTPARTEGDAHRAAAVGSGVAFHSGAPPSALRDCRDALSRANAAFLSSTMWRAEAGASRCCEIRLAKLVLVIVETARSSRDAGRTPSMRALAPISANASASRLADAVVDASRRREAAGLHRRCRDERTEVRARAPPPTSPRPADAREEPTIRLTADISPHPGVSRHARCRRGHPGRHRG